MKIIKTFLGIAGLDVCIMVACGLGKGCDAGGVFGWFVIVFVGLVILGVGLP